MAEQEIIVHSGVSWLHDKMREKLEERKQFLMEAIAHGVPEAEYRGFVGRIRECKRQIDELDEVFAMFYQEEEIDDIELGELDE